MKSTAQKDICIVILAAGSSSRLGQPKQLISWQNEPIIQRMAKIALATSARQVVVVLGAYAEQIVSVVAELPVHILINPEWAMGIGSSIRCAIKFIQQTMPDTQGVLLMVCDQPYLTTGHLEHLIQTFILHGNPVVASAYEGTAGVPALFDRALFQELLQLSPDQGGAKIIRNTPNLHCIPFPEGKFDLDTPADLNELEKRKS
ncbi:MAG: nucleotidyltransferase family protein [Cyclobacteriaceae bacterium]|nr:nucleotidyltransferase family protein [Cyclobacteriaceae bacterium]